MKTFAAIVTTLQAERVATAAHLAHLDDALAAIRTLAGDGPPPGVNGRPATHKKLSKRAARHAVQLASVLRELKQGPLPVRELVKQAGIPRSVLARLVKQGAIVATGTTNDRRYARP